VTDLADEYERGYLDGVRQAKIDCLEAEVQRLHETLRESLKVEYPITEFASVSVPASPTTKENTIPNRRAR
jgi:hypothetical protein